MRIGFLGAGRVVSYQLERFKQYDELEVIGFYDIDIVKCKELVDLGYKKFQSIKELAHSDVDVIAISTPSNEHYSSLLEILNTNTKCKFITIEKPTFLKQEEFDLVKEFNHQNEVTLLPIFQNRYNKAVNLAKSLIESGKLGEILNGRIILSWCRPQRYYDQASWRGKWHSDGGALTNQGIHFIDIARYLVGDVENVSFRMDRADIQIECENVAIGSIKLTNGRLISVDISTTSRPVDDMSEISIYGSKGFISLGGLALNSIKNSSFDLASDHDEIIPNGYGFGHEKFYLSLSKCISSKNFSNILSDLDDAKKTSAILNAAYTSAYNQGEIVSTKGPFEKLLGYHPKNKIIFE